ncbi:MAG: Dabb family protein [Bacillota bacterium]|nr:Dabb family protein [Bacillota bacterium]
MVRHIVFWKLKEEACGNTKLENAKIIKEKLEALQGKIPGIIDMQVGINENGGEYDAALISTFESMDALKSYDSHPEHLKVREFVKTVRESRASVDFNI